MQKHQTSRLFRLDELTPEKLIFTLTPEQRKRVPKGLKLHFHKCTQPYKNKGYRHLISRAEYYYYDKTGKQRKASAGSQLLGIIWDDDPEWVYETDKTKSSIKERRQVACENKLAPSRLTARAMSVVFEELIGYEENAVIVKKVPIQVFMMVALVCALRGTTDATSVANYWNNNIKFLRKLCKPSKALVTSRSPSPTMGAPHIHRSFHALLQHPLANDISGLPRLSSVHRSIPS